MRNVQCKVPDSVYKKLEEIAKKQGKTVYQLVKEIIYEYLSRNTNNDGEWIPLEVKVRKLEEELEEIRNRIAELEKTLRRERKGIETFMRRR